MSGANQPAPDVRAHAARPDHANLHRVLPQHASPASGSARHWPQGKHPPQTPPPEEIAFRLEIDPVCAHDSIRIRIMNTIRTIPSWIAGPIPPQGALRLLRLLLVATLALPTALWISEGAISWHSKQLAAWDRTSRLTDLVYQNISRLVDAQLLALEQLQILTDGMDDVTLRAHEHELHRIMAAMLLRLPHVRDVFIFDTAGRVAIHGMQSPVLLDRDLSDLDVAKLLTQGSRVFVSRLESHGSDDRSLFGLAMPRSLQNGKMAGAIATSVDQGFFEAYFREAAVAYGDAEHRAITLRRSDGQLLVRTPPPEATDRSSLDRILISLVKQSAGQAGQFEVRNPRTAERRLIAWRRLANIDMIVLTSIARQAVVREWASGLITQLYFGVPGTLAMFVIILLAIRKTTQAAAETTRRENAEEAVRQSQKMEALGKLTGGMAHDFNNLLAVMLGSAELAKTRPPEKIGRLLDNIIHAGQRASTLTRQLLSFSRTQSVTPRVVALHAEMPQIIDLLKPSLRNDITVSLVVAEDVRAIEVDQSEFEIALLNVAMNSRDAMPDGGRFAVSVTMRTLEASQIADASALAGGCVAISMIDTGPGMPPEVSARAFEPFFTTKDIGRGTGLGLSQVYGFARQAGGTATIDSTPGEGTCVTLLLPRSDKPPESEPPFLRRPDPQTPGKRVLLVEDNADVASVTAEMLHSLGWEVALADRALQALDCLEQQRRPLNMLITDVVLPGGMSGQALAREARRLLPHLPILLVSGCVDAPSAGQAEFEILRKPFSLAQLAQALHDASPVASTIDRDDMVVLNNRVSQPADRCCGSFMAQRIPNRSRSWP
jgi:two-component system NtrC family sensor kinase